MRPKLIVAVSGLTLCFACPAMTRADPIVDFPTDAPPGTAVYGLAPGANGAMWFAESPTGEGNQFEVAEMSESGNILTLAQLTTGGSTQSDTGIFATLVPASDGGVWVAGGGSEQLAHVSPDGSVQPVSMPPGRLLVDGVTAGQDGNAWGMTCNDVYSGQQVTESCEVLEVDDAGTPTSYPLPSFEHTFPEADLSSEGYSTPPALVFAVADGVWVDKPTVSEDGSPIWEAAFVSYGGQVSAEPIPSGARLVAAAAGDAAWWQEPADGSAAQPPAVRFGQITPEGLSAPVVIHDQVAGEPSAFTTFDAGNDGSLLWAEGTPGSQTQTGFMGTITLQGETRFTVAENATTIPLPRPEGQEVWSGTSSFGDSLYQAANGNIWVISGGSPPRLSVLTSSGSFSTFLPGLSGAEEVQMWQMAPSSTGALWFSIDQPNVSAASASGLLARANPLSPPPGEPPFPTSEPSMANELQPTHPTPASSPPRPILGRRGIATVVAGIVKIRLKGKTKFASLSGSTGVPNGSEVDATNGRVRITVATGSAGRIASAEAYGGVFVFHQAREAHGLARFTLSLPLTGCPRSLPMGRPYARSSASAEHHSGAKSRHLWVSEGGGSWGTSGRYVSTTVEGTHWLTLDECDRSKVTVAAGKVRVHDLVNDTTKVLTAGMSYVAVRRPSPGGR